MLFQKKKHKQYSSHKKYLDKNPIVSFHISKQKQIELLTIAKENNVTLSQLIRSYLTIDFDKKAKISYNDGYNKAKEENSIDKKEIYNNGYKEGVNSLTDGFKIKLHNAYTKGLNESKAKHEEEIEKAQSIGKTELVNKHKKKVNDLKKQIKELENIKSPENYTKLLEEVKLREKNIDSLIRNAMNEGYNKGTKEQEHLKDLCRGQFENLGIYKKKIDELKAQIGVKT